MPFDARLPSGRQQTPSRPAVPARSARSRARLPDGCVPRSAIPVIEQWR